MGKQGIKKRKKHGGSGQHKRLPPSPGHDEHGPEPGHDHGPVTEQSRQQAMAARAATKAVRDQLSVGQSKTVRVKRMSANQRQR